MGMTGARRIAHAIHQPGIDTGESLETFLRHIIDVGAVGKFAKAQANRLAIAMNLAERFD